MQHHPAEHPGSFRKFLDEDGHRWQAVQLDQGEALPSLDDFDALWVMGGPMDVWQEDKHPWLVEEKALIREAVAERGMSYLGLCLGHQLLADALGGACGPGTPEIGVCDITMTELGATGVFLDGLDTVFPSLQWHSAEVTQLPEGARVLATSPDCAVQAMQWGPRAYSAQFHLEVEPDTFEQWVKIPEYRSALEKALGTGGIESMRSACEAALPTFAVMAERVYINWMQTTARVVS